jgi:hypothetical protein
MCWQPCPGSPVLAVFSACPVLSIQLCLSFSACPVLPSCSAYPVLHVLFCLSCSACAILSVLPCAVLS